MPLIYEEHAHHYRSIGGSSEQQRDNFVVISNILECIVRLYHGDNDAGKALGIALEQTTISAANQIQLADNLKQEFNKQAGPDDAVSEEK